MNVILFLFLMVMLQGCKSDPIEVEFFINGFKKKTIEAGIIPEKEMKEDYYEHYSGKTITLMDKSRPQDKIKERKWEVGDSLITVNESDGGLGVYFILPEKKGWLPVTLCINPGSKNRECATKYIYVNYEGRKLTEDPEPPVQVQTPPIKEHIKKDPKPPVPPPVPKFIELINTGVTGFGWNSSPDVESCMTEDLSDFSCKIKPSQPVELLSFIVYANKCGGITVNLRGAGLNETFSSALVQGRNQVSLSESTRLKPGVEYTLSCKALAGHSSCPGNEKPRFMNARNCAGVQKKTSKALTLDQRNSFVIADLKFFH